ncbi:MAG: tRNA lysidine(34) synthetase TilS [Bacteroidales bacterium]|nr:tRNA lysidine(34) synthetase TilS [Bacteroidales bacterium]
MIEAFLKYIKANKLCEPGERILLAVSGGVDSVVMLHLFSKTDYPLAIAHCNFQLRGDESDEDETFVRDLAKKYQIPVYVKKCETREYAQEKGISIEMAARDLRYDWFEEICKTQNFKKVAIAHNRNDDEETFFIKLLRGSGLSGLRGIPLQRDKYFRPVMFASRKEILAYAKKNKLTFREDSTNATDDYLRNRVRHHFLPYYDKKFPGGTIALHHSMEKLKEEEVLFRQMLDEKKQTLFYQEEENICIRTDALAKFQPLKIWLFYLLEEFGFNRSTTDQIVKAVDSGLTGQLFYSEKYTLLLDREKLIIKESKEGLSKEFLIQNSEGEIEQPFPLKWEVIKNNKDFSFEKNHDFAYFDADKIHFPLKLRHWQEGDRFIPFGMRGSKLVSDYFIDKKISRFEKEKIWLLVSEEKILWIAGHRASNLYRVSKQTRNIFKLFLK